MRTISARVCIQPFEIAIAFLLIISGTADFFGWGQQDRTLIVLPMWEIDLVNSLAIIAGTFVTIGVMFNLRKLELSGMMILIATFTIRLLLYAVYLGVDWSFAITGVFYTAVIWAAVIRVATLLKGTSLIWMRGDHDAHEFRL